jgi:hypothetical protein
MALSEEEKHRIEEEEAYRAKVREESQPKRKSGCSGCFIAILIILALPILLAITLIAINPAKQFEMAEKNAQSTEGPQDLTANIGKHAYNKINGAYRGVILEVKPCNTAPDIICYVVNQPTFMRPIEAPADNSIVKDETPTP